MARKARHGTAKRKKVYVPGKTKKPKRGATDNKEASVADGYKCYPRRFSLKRAVGNGYVPLSRRGAVKAEAAKAK